MPDYSLHDIVTVILFLTTLPLLMTASLISPGNMRRAFAVMSLVTGTMAGIGIATRDSGPSTWRAFDFPAHAGLQQNSNGGGASFGRASNNGGGGAAGGKATGGKVNGADAAGGNGGDIAGGAGAGGGSGSGGYALASFGRASGATEPKPFKDCPHCPEMVVLKPAYAQLGSRPTDPRAEAAEMPQRVTTFTRSFAIGLTEITIAQFSTFLVATDRAAPACPAYAAASGDMPVECITFADARAYVAWLSEKTGRTYRLPSAAEWEYAARAGSGDAYPAGDNFAEGSANIGRSAVAIKVAGSFPGNGFGLRDMVGSLAEMVSDCWVPHLKNVPTNGAPAIAVPGADCSRRTLKDAAWWELPVFARVSARRPLDVTTARPGVGFRVVREM